MFPTKFRVIIEIKSDDSPPRTVDRIEEATRPIDALIYASLWVDESYTNERDYGKRHIKSIIITKLD
jgi:hypothetical protein